MARATFLTIKMKLFFFFSPSTLRYFKAQTFALGRTNEQTFPNSHAWTPTEHMFANGKKKQHACK